MSAVPLSSVKKTLPRIPLMKIASLLLSLCLSLGVSATSLPPELASREEAFLKLCNKWGADELRVYQATLFQLQKRSADEGDFDAAKYFKEEREKAVITPEMISESLRASGEATRTLRDTVWQRGSYRQCVSPLGYMCSRNGGKWSRGNIRIVASASTPRILLFSNSNCVWMLVDKNTVIQMMIGWSCQVFQPATDTGYASIFSEKSQQAELRVESKARLVEEAKGILLKELGIKCQPLAKKYVSFLQGQLPVYVKRGQFDEAIQIKNRVASLASSRRSSQAGAQSDDTLKGVFVQESHSCYRKIADHQALTITRPEAFELKEKNGKSHKYTLKQSTPDGYLHWYAIEPAYPLANTAIVGRAGNYLYMVFYKDAPDPEGHNAYIRFRAQ